MHAVRSGFLFMMFLSASVATAQISEFPYEARVVVDELFVRSGSGESWHPTQRLTRDAIVTVRRHDPGGWYQITPPEGSFSWVPSRFVRRLDEKTGEISENNVVAFVGSEFGDDTSVWQRSLGAGEKVTILEERELDTLSGPQKMFRILPPRLEWRWIPGAGVVPTDEQRRRQLDKDPYATPSNAARTDSKDVIAHQKPGVGGVTDVPPISPDSQLARLQKIRREQKQLGDIDRRFREMVLQDPSNWSLDSIENEYRALQNQTSYKPVAGQIDLRYPAIQRYRQRQAEYEDFRQLTSQTERRDAELVAQLGPAAIINSLTSSSPPPGQNASFQELVVDPAAAAGTFAELVSSTSTSSQPVAAPDGTAEIPVNEVHDLDAFDVPSAASLTADEGSSSLSFSGVPAPIDPLPTNGAPEDFSGPEGIKVSENISLSDGHDSTAGSADNLNSTEFTASNSPPLQTLTVNHQNLSEDELPAAFHAEGNLTSKDFVTTAGSDTAADSHTRSRYVGAGIVQRAAAGEQQGQFVLMTPAGRVLAVLKPVGNIRIDQFTGQSVGVHGNRWPSRTSMTKPDFIEVTGIEPVRIR